MTMQQAAQHILDNLSQHPDASEPVNWQDVWDAMRGGSRESNEACYRRLVAALRTIATPQEADT